MQQRKPQQLYPLFLQCKSIIHPAFPTQLTDHPFSSLPNLLINRFVLNLRAFSGSTVQHSGKGPSNTTVNTLSVPKFAENRFIGNMGAPLDPNQWDELWDDVNEVEDEGGESSWEILEGENPLTTLVPVVSCVREFAHNIWELITCGATGIWLREGGCH